MVRIKHSTHLFCSRYKEVVNTNQKKMKIYCFKAIWLCNPFRSTLTLIWIASKTFSPKNTKLKYKAIKKISSLLSAAIHSSKYKNFFSNNSIKFLIFQLSLISIRCFEREQPFLVQKKHMKKFLSIKKAFWISLWLLCKANRIKNEH